MTRPLKVMPVEFIMLAALILASVVGACSASARAGTNLHLAEAMAAELEVLAAAEHCKYYFESSIFNRLYFSSVGRLDFIHFLNFYLVD